MNSDSNVQSTSTDKVDLVAKVDRIVGEAMRTDNSVPISEVVRQSCSRMGIRSEHIHALS